MVSTFVESVVEPKKGTIDPDRLSARLRITLSTLSTITRVHRNTLHRSPDNPLTQERLGQVVKIIARAAEMVGDDGRAIIWFRYQPIPGFDHKTAEDLVAAGQAEAVMKHLDCVENGGFA